MAGTEFEAALDRLPDGSVRRRAELDAAAALVATDLLVAAATKAAEVLAAARLATVQRSTAREMADRYRAAAMEFVERSEATADLARKELSAQEAAAEDLAVALEAALREVAAAEESATVALRDFEDRLSSGADVATSRLRAAEELADARLRAARTLADARRLADSRLAAAARLAASKVAEAGQTARAEQAKELATAHAEAAEELAVAQAEAAAELAAAQAEAAEELTVAALAAAAQIGVARDEAAKELAEAETQFRLVMDWAFVAGCTVSADGRFLRVNSALCELLGRSAEELLGASLQDVTHPDDVGVLAALVRDLLAGGRRSFRTLSRYLASDNRVVWGDLSIAAVPNVEGGADFHIAQIVDVTERVGHEVALLAMSTHDALTGLANRAAVLDEANRALSAQTRSGRATAVLVVDLDHFKNVNDALGHSAGDELLRAATARIVMFVRAGDMAARPGGDEFVLVMRDLDEPADAVRAAWRIVEAFRQPFLVDGNELYATVSIGVAIAGHGAQTTSAELASNAGDLLREADTAMYQAKAEGRDRVSVYNEDLRAIVTARLAVEGDLRQALERDQLAVWYQPEINLTTGAVIAVEALLRWHHPDGSVWTADRFIDVAEDSGMILDIGDWVLHTACAQGAAWAAARPDQPIIVRVNNSALQIAEASLLAKLDGAIAASGLDPALLCIEITETALLRQTATASDNLAGIHERGIAIAIDDFGTGYASLLYLRRYPIDVIKIDRSFVTDIATNEHDRAITIAVVALAAALGLTVTAEGVEHPAQAAVLREIGCPGAQGWLYSKAVPSDEVTALLDHIYPHA